MVYKISNSLFNFTSNGGSNNQHNLSFAFDNDLNTYWESAKYQGEEDSFVNNIQITFLKTVTIDKMIYEPQNIGNIKGYGYPIELKIYFKLRNPDGTLSDDDSDFLLVDEIISERSENKVLIIFDQEITCDQIKLEWAQIEEFDLNKPYALANEIIFLFPENIYINQLIYDIP